MLEFTPKKAGDILGQKILPEEEFECKKHGAYRGQIMIIFGEKVFPPCPECDRETLEEETRRKMAAEARGDAIREEERIKRLTEMNIGKKFWNESFDTFKAYTPALKNYLDSCVTFANNPHGRMLLMLGKNGNGKNHLAASILQKTGGCIYSVFEIELLLKECYSGKTGEADLYRHLCNIPLLVINEIGKHKSDPWEMNFLSYIINKRYENFMPTVLISNAHLKVNCPQKGCSDCFQNLLGNDVLSRIVENGEIMIFNEDDYRYKKREMREGENAVSYTDSNTNNPA